MKARPLVDYQTVRNPHGNPKLTDIRAAIAFDAGSALRRSLDSTHEALRLYWRAQATALFRALSTVDPDHAMGWIRVWGRII